MSFFSDLLKEKSLWWAIGGALTVYLAVLFLDRYYMHGQQASFVPTNTTYVKEFEQDNQGSQDNNHHPGIKVQKPDFILDLTADYRAVIKTEYGNITVDLFEKLSPNIVNNFVYLAQSGYYNNIYWHRIIPKIVIQTGDPTGSGNGGPGYYVKGDFNANLPKYGPGIIGMANDGNKDHNGSQFFIVASGVKPEMTQGWESTYPIFAKVVSGMDVVDKIASIKTDKNGKPSKHVKIYSIQIVKE